MTTIYPIVFGKLPSELKGNTPSPITNLVLHQKVGFRIKEYEG